MNFFYGFQALYYIVLLLHSVDGSDERDIGVPVVVRLYLEFEGDWRSDFVRDTIYVLRQHSSFGHISFVSRSPVEDEGRGYVCM
jgi:hypothetical protein